MEIKRKHHSIERIDTNKVNTEDIEKTDFLTEHNETKPEADFSTPSESTNEETDYTISIDLENPNGDSANMSHTDTADSNSFPDTVQEKSAQEKMKDYLYEHNYGQEDSDTYMSDPEWISLNRELKKELGTPQTPKERMNDYMGVHNYTINDFSKYSEDPEWQALNLELLNDDTKYSDYKEKPKIETNPFLFTDTDRAKIREGIRSGDIGEKEIRDIGRQVSERVDILTNEKYEELQQIEHKRSDLIKKHTWADSTEEIEAARAEIDELRDREISLRESLKQPEIFKQVLSETRSIGPMEDDKGQSYVNESDILAKPVMRAIDNCRHSFPTEWIEKSNDADILAKHTIRGYFDKDGDVSIIALSSGRGMERCAYHELGHHFEDLYPEIRKLEHEFYNRRTEGERLRWLGIGYGFGEKTRRDNFVESYMGKDYGNTEESGYEILSMGVESVYAGSYNLKKDPEYRDFIYGILAST